MPCNSKPTFPPPPGWGADQLTGFMQTASSAAWGAFVQPNTKPFVQKLVAIDATFLDAIDA